MKITGTSHLVAPRSTVWQALNDPAVLVRTIPGCRRLEALGGDVYAMTLAAGVGSVKGVYDGQVRLSDQQEPGSFRLQAQGSGAPGTIAADVLVTLRDADGGTSLTYDADATVGGMIGGVGQRMLVGVSKRMAGEFFANVDSVLSAAVGSADLPDGAGAPKPSTVAPAPSVRPTSPAAAGTVYTSSQNGGNGEGRMFARGVGVGAVAALAGVFVGAWITRRGGKAG